MLEVWVPKGLIREGGTEEGLATIQQDQLLTDLGVEVEHRIFVLEEPLLLTELLSLEVVEVEVGGQVLYAGGLQTVTMEQ
jgi:hypothetical protein